MDIFRVMEHRIKELRRAANRTQEEVAAAIGVPQSTYQKIEAGKRGLTLRWMRQISGVLDCTPADLLADQDNPYRLAPREKMLVDTLRALTDDERERMERVLDAMAAVPTAPATA